MQNKILSSLAHIAIWINQKWLIKKTRRQILLPFYHAISDDDMPHISNLYDVRSTLLFKEDLDYFCKYFEPISLNELIEIVEGKSNIKHPVFHLTFDDGLRAVFSVIAPILQERNIPATFFVNTDFIDNQDLFYRYKVGLILNELKTGNINKDRLKQIHDLLNMNAPARPKLISKIKKLTYHETELIDQIAFVLNLDLQEWLKQNRPYLTSEEIIKLNEQGFSFGSHSKDHPRFKHITLSDQKIQVHDSFKALKSQFTLDKKVFSFPFGDEKVGKSFFNWLFNEEECMLSFGVSGLKDDFHKNHLHRIPMDECGGKVEPYIKSHFLYFLLKEIINKNKVRRT